MVKDMNSKTIVAVFFVTLLSFFLFVNPIVAQDDVEITIKGGFQIKIFIENNGDEMVFADFVVTAKGLRYDIEDMGEDIPIPSDKTFYYKRGIPGLTYVSASATVGDYSLTRRGISFMYFVIFFR